MKLKETVYNIFYNEDDNTPWHYRLDDYFISSLIVLSIISIILESIDSLYNKYHNFFTIFDYFTVAVFSLEYILRIWVVDFNNNGKKKLNYIFSPMGIIDLLAIVPFYLPFLMTLDLRFLRIIRLLRLFRIFKLAHYSNSLRLVGKVIKKTKSELSITIFGTFIIILITSALMYEIEHEVQPDQFPNIFATFWWAIATLTTIGYGDVYPVTGMGQFLAAITAIFGIGMVAIPTGILSMGFMEEISNKEEKSEDTKKNELNYCPHCGKKLPH